MIKKVEIKVVLIGLVIFFIGLIMVLPTFAIPPTVSNIISNSNVVGLYEKYEIRFDLNTSFNNPFDPGEIDIRGIFTSPTNMISTTFAFWYESFTMSGGVNGDEIYTSSSAPYWMIRYTPKEVGNYSYFIEIETGEGMSISSTLQFTVNTSDHPGFIRIHSENKKYFQYDNGNPYYPIGHNVAGNSDGTDPKFDGVTSARYYHSRMSPYHINWLRFWITNIFKNAIEWTGSGYPGLGKYALDKAYRVDKILESATDNDIYVQLTLLDFRQFSNWAYDYWPQCPYNAVNGGPVPNGSPQDFYTNSTAKKYYKQQLRYIISRWGYLPNLFAWEFFNEMQYTGDTDQNPFTNNTIRDKMKNWHQEMGQYIRSLDPNQHLITTSSDDPWYGRYGYYTYSLFSSLWLIPEIDIVQTHIYTSTLDEDIANQSRMFHQIVDKPHMVGEFSIKNLPEVTNTTTNTGGGTGFNPATFIGTNAQRDHLIQGTEFHNTLWTALMNETMSASWWWEYYLESNTTMNRISPQFPLYYHYKPFYRFIYSSVNPGLYSYEDLGKYQLTVAQLSTSSSIKAYGLSTSDKAFIWFRDIDNNYFSGMSPGNLVNRTISNATIRIYNMDLSALFFVQYYDTYHEGGPIGERDYLVSSGSGEIVIPLPSFQRDLALKLFKSSSMTSVELIWKKF